MGSSVTVAEARLLLGPASGGDAAALTAAFRLAVKSARPDREGGDAERFRRLIEAYRLLQAEGPSRPALPPPRSRPASRPVLAIDVATALNGGIMEIAGWNGARLRVRVPAGLRTGDHLRLKGAGQDGADRYVPIRIQGDDALRAVGDDLYMTADVEPRLLADGGRAEILTHAGPRSVWLVGGGVQPNRLRLRGLGLPARGSRPQGHLFVTLTPGEDTPSAAAHLLDRFSAVWTPTRLAA